MKTIVLIARVIVILIIALFVLRHVASAQKPLPQADMTINAAIRNAVIDTLLKELNDAYVFPETAKKMEADIRSRINANEYDNVMSAIAFAQKLTTDLQSVSKDKHLRVRYSARTLPPVRTDRREPTEVEREQIGLARVILCDVEPRAARLEPGDLAPRGPRAHHRVLPQRRPGVNGLPSPVSHV